VFEAVLVWSPDRLARRYAYQVVLLEELTRCGCEVVFVHHPFGHSPEEQMLLQIPHSIAFRGKPMGLRC